MNSKRIQTVAALVLSLLVAVYVGYKLFLNDHRAVLLETAQYGSVSDTVQVEAVALRQETILGTAPQGVLNYRVSDGERVARNGVVAQVFASEADAAAQNELERLDREIASLETLARPAEYFSADARAVNGQIGTAVDELLTRTTAGDYAQLTTLKEGLLTAMNRQQLLTGEVKAEDYQSRIASLQGERDALAARSREATGTVTSSVAGYFIRTVDGMENAYDLDRITTITPGEVQSLLETEPAKYTGGAVGKVAGEFSWYLVCLIPQEELGRFDDVTEITAELPFATATKLPVTLLAKNPDKQGDRVALVFRCKAMNSDVAGIRQESVLLHLRTYEGVLVNEKAIRFADVTVYDEDAQGNETSRVEENVKGVYVQRGQSLQFVQVFTEKTVNGYAICKTELSDGELSRLVTDRTIQLYDRVVVEGTDLYDGKVVG